MELVPPMSFVVAVNLLYLRPGQVGGSETYVRKLLSSLSRRSDLEIVAVCPPGVEDGFPGVRVVRVGHGPYSESRRLLGENLLMAPALRRLKANVLFSPANFGAPLLPLRIPQVVTVHDLQHDHFPEWFSPSRRAIRTAAFRATFLRARHVIAISQFTRDDLLRRYSLSARRVSVIYEGADPLEANPRFADEAVKRHGLEGAYFVYPAMITPHKNHRVLIDAWAGLPARARTPTLVFTGKDTPHLQSLLDAAAQRGVASSVRYLGYLPRNELLGLIARARGLLFPSWFEGFGLPILEAMQLGTPVVSSTASSLPEVTGDAALMAAPDDAAAWVDAVTRLLDDEPLRRELVSRGFRNVARFSWQRCADETAKVLREAAR